MTWAEFKALVIEELGTDGNRRGIETLRLRAMRDAVVDLQRYIRAYRQGHGTRYDEADLEEKGYAHLGALPTGANPKAFYTISLVPDADGNLPDPNTNRNRLDYVAWADRLDIMVRARNAKRNYQYAVSPFSKQFMVHPLINDETYLLVVWEGLKMDFAEGDEVPFPEQAAAAVGAYVKWRILLEVDRRPDLALMQYDIRTKTGIYPTLRLALYKEGQEPQMADGKDEEYVTDSPEAPGAQGAQQGSVALTDGDTTATIVFPTAYGSAPIVNCWVVAPDSSAFVISASPDGSSITGSGFTALLAAAIPAAGYKLYWEAAPAS